METKDIKDFSDLGQAEKFKYNGRVYAIPPLSRSKMAELFRINQKISAHVKDKEKEKKASGLESDDVSDTSIDEMDELFKMQQEFVLAGIRRDNEDGSMSPVLLEEIEEWPMRLLHNVIKMVNDALTITTIKEDDRPT